MAYKTILTIWDGQEQGQRTFENAIGFATAQNAHLDVLCLGIDRVEPGLYYAGASPAIIGDGLNIARHGADACEASAQQILGAKNITWSSRKVVAQISSISNSVGAAARFCDCAVLSGPYADGAGDDDAIVMEAVLFDGHTPVMICPQDRPGQIGKRIVVAWNQSAQALHAIRTALPLLKQAEIVDVAIVDPGRHHETEADPGVALATMLARHGANVSVTVLARTVPTVAEVLNRHLLDFDADLLVMGAYGHSRFRESILGGATRDILKNVITPVFMAH